MSRGPRPRPPADDRGRLGDVGTGSGVGGAGELTADELAAMRADDALLDALGRGEPVTGDDDLAEMLGAWRAEMDTEPLPAIAMTAVASDSGLDGSPFPWEAAEAGAIHVAEATRVRPATGRAKVRPAAGGGSRSSRRAARGGEWARWRLRRTGAPGRRTARPVAIPAVAARGPARVGASPRGRRRHRAVDHRGPGRSGRSIVDCCTPGGSGGRRSARGAGRGREGGKGGHRAAVRRRTPARRQGSTAGRPGTRRQATGIVAGSAGPAARGPRVEHTGHGTRRARQWLDTGRANPDADPGQPGRYPGGGRRRTDGNPDPRADRRGRTARRPAALLARTAAADLHPEPAAHPHPAAPAALLTRADTGAVIRPRPSRPTT